MCPPRAPHGTPGATSTASGSPGISPTSSTIAIAATRGNQDRQASFGVAVSRRYQVNNEWQEQTSFFNVVAWGTLGENAAASLTKGTRIIVTGRLEQRSYETKEGEKREEVTYVDIESYGKQAEIIAKYCGKGSGISAEQSIGKRDIAPEKSGDVQAH